MRLDPRFISLFFAVSLVACTTSCSMRYATVKPPVKAAETYSARGTTPLPDHWWKSFNDAQLDELIETALRENLTLRIAWDRLAQAEALANKAGASLLPSVDGQGRANRTVSHEKVTTAGVQTEQTVYRSSPLLGVFASYELDLWGRVRSGRDAAVLDARATEAQLRAAAISLTASVAATWYELVEAYGQVELLKSQLKINEEVLELVTLRFRRGQVTAADVLRQRQLVESRRGDIVSSESRATVLEHQLAILLGQEPNANVAKRTTDLVKLPALPDTGLPAELLQRRPDVRQAYYNVLAADRRVAVAVADRFPRISLSAEVSTSGRSTRDLFDNWLATVAANVVAPLFDAGSRKAEVQRACAVVSERINDYGQTILDSLKEVEDALAQEAKQREFVESLDKQVELSAQVIERSRDSYLSGAVDYLRVLDALSTHQALERTLLQARQQLIRFRVNLCRALGGGWELTRPEPRTLRPKSD